MRAAANVFVIAILILQCYWIWGLVDANKELAAQVEGTSALLDSCQSGTPMPMIRNN